MRDKIISFPGISQGLEIDLPRVIDIEPAVSGSRGDDHTFAVAKQIAACTADFELYAAWMREWNRTCRPPWDENRLGHNIRKGWREVHGEALEGCPEFYVPPPDNLLWARRSRLSIKALNRIAFSATGAFAEMLEAFSKKKLPPLEVIIDQMYPGDPLLCRAAGSETWARTAPRESIRGVEHEFEWIVPSPMSKETGHTKEGKPGSHRCRDNSGPRIYLVIEFDFDPKTFGRQLEAWAKKGISGHDVQAALIRHLALEGEPRQWPFMIVDTGGKSLHSWYEISWRFPEQSALDLLARAIPLGADKRAEQPEQFFRFPGGHRKSEKGQPQTILFYNEKNLVRLRKRTKSRS